MRSCAMRAFPIDYASISEVVFAHRVLTRCTREHRTTKLIDRCSAINENANITKSPRSAVSNGRLTRRNVTANDFLRACDERPASATTRRRCAALSLVNLAFYGAVNARSRRSLSTAAVRCHRFDFDVDGALTVRRTSQQHEEDIPYMA